MYCVCLDRCIISVNGSIAPLYFNYAGYKTYNFPNNAEKLLLYLINSPDPLPAESIECQASLKAYEVLTNGAPR